MSQAAIELSLGIRPDVSKYHNNGICAGVRFIPAEEGKIVAIKGLDEIENMRDIINLEIIGKVGKNYSKATDDSGRFGYVVCKGKTTAEALDRCQRVIERIKFVLE